MKPLIGNKARMQYTVTITLPSQPYTLTPSSGGGRGRKSTRGGRGSQKKQGTEMNTSCAWFDSDPVFGFPLDS